MNIKTVLFRNVSSRQTEYRKRNFLVTLLAICIVNFANTAHGVAQSVQNPSTPFTGEKSLWHGFDRYDFIMDEETLSITPFKSPENERNGVKDPEKGQRRCIVVVPKKAATWELCRGFPDLP